MKHVSKYDNQEYEISAFIESVGMYFGDYDYNTTEIYIKEWHKKKFAIQ